ncbi:MAG: penicillin-binding transpeptidase domain-containing protein, partial [Planctomycetota bacterium]
MFSKRIKIFMFVATLLLLVCLASLAKMQLLSGSYYLERIAELKQQRSHSRQLKTIRGKILDSNGSVLATDIPQFLLCLNYTLSRFMDSRHQQTMLLNALQKQNARLALMQVRQEIDARLEDLDCIIEKCVLFGIDREKIEERINQINDQTWNLRLFLAWRRNCLDAEMLKKYDNNISNIPQSAAIADFVKKVPDNEQRLLLVAKVTDIAEMNKDWPLFELKTNDDIFTAQLEFMDADGVRILSNAHRFYPYQSVAAQTIGWVGSAKGTDRKLFASDKLLSYLDYDVCGREDGAEYVCEAVLRGRRGELVYDIDQNLQSRTETQFGKDIRLTLDIELQQKIETHFLDCQSNPNCKAPTTAAVIDVTGGDILALVSLPAFDLNRIRYDYRQIESDPNAPLLNRAINKQYPPGSVVKPMILIAALESGKSTADDVISCPARKAPKGWPSCWRYNRYRLSHDGQWENNAH